MAINIQEMFQNALQCKDNKKFSKISTNRYKNGYVYHFVSRQHAVKWMLRLYFILKSLLQYRSGLVATHAKKMSISQKSPRRAIFKCILSLFSFKVQE